MTTPLGNDPSGYDDGTNSYPDANYPGADGSVTGAGFSAMKARTRDAVVAQKKAEISGGLPGNIFGMVWEGLDDIFSLPFAILKKLADILGLGGVYNVIEDIVDKLGDWAMDVASGIANAASDGLAALAKIGAFVAAAGKDLIEDVGHAIAHAGENIQDMIDGIVNGISGGATTIGHGVADIIHALGNIPGANIIGELADNLMPSLGWLRDVLANAFGVAGTGHDSAAVSAAAITLAETALRADGAAIQANLAIAALAKGLNSSNDGAVFDLDFTGADGAALNATDWPTTGPTAGDVCVRLTNTFAAMGIKSSVASSSSATNTVYAYCGHQFETNDQTIEVVLSGGNSDFTSTSTKLHFHCDTTKSRGIYAAITYQSVTLGYFVTTGGARVYTPFGGNGTVATNLSSGMRVAVRNIGNEYQILINGVLQPSYIDTANKAVAGDFDSFISLDRRTKVWNAGLPWQSSSVRDSFYLTEVLVADYAPIVYAGSGARMYRTSTANVGVSSGLNILADNTFSVDGGHTSDITLDLTAGKFTVSKAGWYYVTVHMALTSSSDSGSGSTGVGYNVTPFPMQMAIFKNGSLEKYVGESLRAYVTSVGITGGGNVINIAAVGPEVAYGSGQVYLGVGDFVQVGYNANSSDSSTFTGDATGTRTYFEIIGAGA